MYTSYLLITAIAMNTIGLLFNASGHSIISAICIAVGYALLFLWVHELEREVTANKRARQDLLFRIGSLEESQLSQVRAEIFELRKNLNNECREQCEKIRLELGEKLTDWEKRHE